MILKHLNDQDLLQQTKNLVSEERKQLTKILHHLREVERRKLFSDLAYSSLFSYAVSELRYSEGQAGRRIRAMRLLKEIPEIESKIESGKLSLSNISQAQSYFREAQKQHPEKKISLKEKVKLLQKLENKSAREGQKVLLKMQLTSFVPVERERVISESHIEVRLILTNNQKKSIDDLRSLLGATGQKFSLAELIDYMTVQCISSLKIKNFGKKRVEQDSSVLNEKCAAQTRSNRQHSKSERYIGRALKYEIWKRDQAQCQICQGKQNINYDHIKPIALGGKSTPENLRLLCFNCNQRQAIKTFGQSKVEMFSRVSPNMLK